MNKLLCGAMACALLWPLVVPAQDDASSALRPGDSPPPTTESRLAEAGDADDYTGFDHVIVHEEAVNRVDERGVTYVDSRVVYKILTEAGCRNMSVLGWDYDPQSSWVEVREASLIREGERIPVALDNVLDLPAPQRAIYWSNRTKLLQLPRLEVNDGIEVVVFRKGFTYALLDGADGATAAAGGDEEDSDDRFIPPMPGEYFDVVLFQAAVPILEKRYELHLPAAKRLHSQVYNGALYASTTYTADSNVYTWWGLDMAASPDEPRQPADSDFVTKVVMATVESWEAKSRWFFEINDSQFDSSPEIDARVRQILDRAGVADGSDADKAEVLLHWVAQNIRYSGQTMGKGEGFTLHPGTMIFEQRSGVCKDIAGMLVTMMRAADIPTYAAMTMAGSRIEEVPADQFNHCVVARQDGDSWVMYDPTWVPYNNDIWSKLETEQHYVIGSPQGETLRQIPYSPPRESPLKARHDARLSADGTLEGTIRLEGRGASDGRLRRLLTHTPKRHHRQRVAGILAAMSERVELLRLDHHPVDDFSRDMWIEVAYRAPGLALPVDGGLELASPLMAVLIADRGLFGAGATEWDEERSTDLFLYHTQLVDAVETITLAAGLGTAELPEPAEVDETYASFSASAEQDGSRLVIRSRATVKRRQIPPAGYGGFRRAIEAAREWADATVRLEPDGRPR